MNREALGYALLFSVPPGVGITGLVTYATGGGLVTPTAAFFGGVTAAVIFAVVFVAAITNPEEPDPESA